MSADFPWAEIQNLLQAWALLALVTGLIVGLVVLLTRSPLPWQRRQHFAAVPWTFVDLALVLLLFVVGEYVIVVLMHQVRGPDAAPALPSSPARELLLTTTQLGLCAAQAAGGPSVGEAFMPAVAATAADRSLEVLNHRAETALWGTLISRLLLPVAFVLFLHLRAGARPYQVGLTRHAFGSSLLLGYLCWLVVTPLVFALFLGLRALEDWIGAGDPHLVQVLLSLNQGWQPWVLALIIAGLVAPLFEELLVRGIMQPLLVARPQLADGLVLTSLVLAVFLGLGLDGESNSA
ncbi:MAG TPA: CPBP family glutamic-type intramembrane protease, partial [Gemmatales bacterium]|nr:CPBP family glutamic-type intramembrane protease [Gemmatales bacterium]